MRTKLIYPSIILLGLLFFVQRIEAQEIKPENIKALADKELVDIINAEVIPFNSLDSDDFSDLQFLKETLASKRIVYLGESNHHSESYNKIKFRIVRFLQSEMNFNVIAFESSIYSCVHSNLVKDSINSFYLLTHSILGAWRTPVMTEFMNYIKTSKMELSGIDPNANAAMLDKRHYFSILPNNHNLANELYHADSLNQAFHTQRSTYFGEKKLDELTEKELDEVQHDLKQQYLKLSVTEPQFLLEKKTKLLIKKIIENRIYALNLSNKLKSAVEEKYLTNEDREKWMANNLKFLTDTIYNDQKIIIWAHNAHISKGGQSTFTEERNSFINNSLGYQLNKMNPEESYHIALFGFPGIIGQGYSKEVTYLQETKKNSLEAILYHSKNELSFLKLSKEKLPFFNKPRINFTELNFTNSSILNDCYDGIIFIKNLTPSILIRPQEKEFYEKKYSGR